MSDRVVTEMSSTIHELVDAIAEWRCDDDQGYSDAIELLVDKIEPRLRALISERTPKCESEGGGYYE